MSDVARIDTIEVAGSVTMMNPIIIGHNITVKNQAPKVMNIEESLGASIHATLTMPTHILLK